jgi:phospholipid transport system substrate-binding protein
MFYIQKICFNLLSIFLTIISISNISFASNDNTAEAFISNLSADALKIIQSKDSEETKMRILEDKFNSSVDVDWMAKFAIAKFWKSMTDKQKQAYLKAYNHYLIKTYVPRFKEYNNDEIKITGTKDMGSDQYVVSTQIITKKGPEKHTINIAYRCKNTDGSFKIRDISGEDISLLTTQRSEFASVVASGGIDKLIQTLATK